MQGTSFSLVVQLSKNGTVFYSVVPASAAQPSYTPASLRAVASGAGNVTVEAACGNITISQRGVNTTAVPTCCAAGCSTVNIQQATSYYIYLTAQDAATGGANLMTSSPYVISVTTLDQTAPLFGNLSAAIYTLASGTATPVVTANTPTLYAYSPNAGGVTLNVSVVLNKPGRVFYLALPQSQLVNPPATPAALRSSAGVSTLYIANASATYNASVPSLPASKSYNFYLAAEDLADLNPIGRQYLVGGVAPSANLQSALTVLQPVTANIFAPAFVTAAGTAYPYIAPATLTSARVTVSVRMNKV